jgi:hypothetical protein
MASLSSILGTSSQLLRTLFRAMAGCGLGVPGYSLAVATACSFIAVKHSPEAGLLGVKESEQSGERDEATQVIERVPLVQKEKKQRRIVSSLLDTEGKAGVFKKRLYEARLSRIEQLTLALPHRGEPRTTTWISRRSRRCCRMSGTSWWMSP